METLGGSRRGDNAPPKAAGATQGRLGAGAAGGGLLDRPASAAAGRAGAGAGQLARTPPPPRQFPDPVRTGAMGALLGGGSAYAAARGRPSSAPRERAAVAGGAAGANGASMRAHTTALRKTKIFPTAPRDAAPSTRALPERDVKRDLPAFWSVRTHGQPFNDDRLANGATNFFRLAQPAGLSSSAADATGPATLQQAALHKSLEAGRCYFNSLADLAPLPLDDRRSGEQLAELSPAGREYLLGRLTPYQRIHALAQCLDQAQGEDWLTDPTYQPWPLAVLNREHLTTSRLEARRQARLETKARARLAADADDEAPVRVRPEKYDKGDWGGGPAQKDMLVRLAIAELEYMMRRHLKFMSDRECNAARAPAAMQKDLLKQAFWRVDPQKTGCVSIQQFLQVWQNLLRLIEYVDEWVPVKDFKGRTKRQQVLRPIADPVGDGKRALRTVLLDRNMAAALFVKYGFDKDGLMPYVVFINALCETPARLLGHEVVLNKSERGKNGLEDEMDIALCLGNAKIDYRYCKSGVFPPGEFTAQMGKRSFNPPKAHMWLEHVYGYAGMLHSTLQSNVFYTHNTGNELSEHTRAAVVKRLCEAQGAASEAELRTASLMRTEFVYYTGGVGVVFDKEKFDAGLPCQRYFFGHNNDIQCLTIHPNRKFVATGQQKATGDLEVPYVCVWDVDHCMQLARLDHGRGDRSVIAVCFSGDMMDGRGGELLITVTSDDRHCIHVWQWLPHANKYVNAQYIPGWSLGPEKKIGRLKAKGMYFTNDDPRKPEAERVDDSWLNHFPFEVDAWRDTCGALAQAEGMASGNAQSVKAGSGGSGRPTGRPGASDPQDVDAILAASRTPLSLKWPLWEEAQWWEQPVPTPGSEAGPCPLWSHLEHPDVRVRAEDADGFYFGMRAARREEGPVQQGADEEKLKLPHHVVDMNGCNGTPPMVYGVVWNPMKPSDGRRGSEFASYGVKHLKVWVMDDTGNYVGTIGSFGTERIENVLSALYVPAMHAMRSPGDSVLLTGFASGKMGMWVPPYPTRPGSTYTLTRYFDAHGPGKRIALNDGTQVHGGVRALKLRKGADGGLEVLSGGADGTVRSWRLEEVAGERPDGTPLRGVKLGKTGDKPFLLMGPSAANVKADPPLVVAVDCHPSLPIEFLAGTNGCDIWEVDADPRILVEGHEDLVDELAAHPRDPHTFASACKSGRCRIWDARRRDTVMCADLGYPLCGVAYSQEPLPFKSEPAEGAARRSAEAADEPPVYHLAVSGEAGQLTVMRCDNLRPLVHKMDVPSRQAIPELKYSPAGGPRMLAAAAADLTVYIYRADRNYQLLSKCMGHSGTVTHVDWSLPIVLPGTPHTGKFVLQSCDTAGDLLYWDPHTGKKLPYNMRDTEWHTWTLTVGFDVMGVWPDASDGTDVNSVDRCRLGAPIYDPFEAAHEQSKEAAFHLPDPKDCADGVSGAGYLVTADDFSTVKLFNYPVVADDAPYKAFRGHSSHVTAVRYLADDRLVVSVGGLDRGIYQWRTCGVASGLPPLPVIYEMLGAVTRDARSPEEAVEDRETLWGGLHDRARAFRSYERLKLYGMRVALEAKRNNSARSAVPQPKLPQQLTWGEIEGTKQWGPLPKQAAGGGGKAGGAAGGGGGGGKGEAGAGDPGESGSDWDKASVASAAPSQRGGGGRGGAPGAATPRSQYGGATPSAAPPAAPSVAASRPRSSRAPTARSSRASSILADEDGDDDDFGGEEVSIGASGVPAYKPPGTRPASTSSRGAGAGGRGPSAPSSRPGTPQSESVVGGSRSGSVAAGPVARGAAGGRSGKRYSTQDSVAESLVDSGIPDEF